MERERMKKQLRVKKPFTRVMAEGRDDDTEFFGKAGLESVRPDRMLRKKVTQEKFLKELDPLGHLIYDREYYPDIRRYDDEAQRWYIEEVPRYAFAFQSIILTKHLTHLCGNDIVFELADDYDNEHSREVLNAFKRGWAKKDMEIAWYELARASKSFGDGAIAFYLDNNRFGWKKLTFANGDVLYPHYSRKTGQLTLFAREYSNYDEYGEVRQYIDVWDKDYFYCLCENYGETEARIQPKGLLSEYDTDGYVLLEQSLHGFGFVPVAYHRCDDGPCWSKSQESIDNYEMAFSRLAQSNHDFGLPIMYVKGEGSEELSSADMSYTSKVLMLPEAGEAGFLNRQDASNAYKAELAILEDNIYRQSFAVRSPELKSGDTPGVAIKMMYSDAYENAINDAQQYQHAINDMVRCFIHGYGIEKEMRLDFLNTDISFYIEPYIHVNETERATILSMGVQNGYCSKQTAAEKFTLSTPQETDRILREKRHEDQTQLLLEEQLLEVKNQSAIELQNGLSEADRETKTAKQQGRRHGKVATGRGSTHDGTYNNPAYDRWGNPKDEDGKVNRWDEWDKTH